MIDIHCIRRGGILIEVYYGTIMSSCSVRVRATNNKQVKVLYYMYTDCCTLFGTKLYSNYLSFLLFSFRYFTV
jgi:hypothetical protein